MDIAARFGQNLLRCRKRVGVSQEELAVRASLHRTQIGLLERGGRLPRIDTLVKVAGALDVPAGELLDGIAWRPGYARRGGWEEGRQAASEQPTTPKSTDAP
ncbi:MAG TPA: helix-turn-helix transcriptional regulator [Solirubrobacterales bacterium]|nr:helix-turn-helix transcriptional regulator [Solirubrobacterales bacterium]